MNQPTLTSSQVRLFVLLLVTVLLGLVRFRPGAAGGAAAAVVLLLALARPGLFGPLVRIAQAAGGRLGRLLFALLAALVYFLLLTPLALALRLAGRPFLPAGPERGRDSYWEEGLPPGNLDKQF